MNVEHLPALKKGTISLSGQEKHNKKGSISLHKNSNKMPNTSMGGTQTDDPLNQRMQLSAWTPELCLNKKKFYAEI